MLWLVLALPALWIGLRWSITPDQYGYGHAIGDSGDWAAWLLMATLAVTPLRLAFRRSGWTLWLMRRRRDIGVASFYHVAHDVTRKTDIRPTVNDVTQKNNFPLRMLIHPVALAVTHLFKQINQRQAAAMNVAYQVISLMHIQSPRLLLQPNLVRQIS